MLILPMVTSGIAVFYTWNLLLDPFGPLSVMFTTLKLGALVPRQGWLGDIHTALPASGRWVMV